MGIIEKIKEEIEKEEKEDIRQELQDLLELAIMTDDIFEGDEDTPSKKNKVLKFYLLEHLQEEKKFELIKILNL